MRKSFELCCASAHSHSVTEEIPIARRCHDELKATGRNPTLDEVIEAVRHQHGVILDRREASLQIMGHRQGYSSTSGRAHLASCNAAEASDRARTGKGDHTTAHDAHEAAAKAHMDACLYHGRAMAYHEKKVENQSVELDEPADEETTENVSD
jgi:hypothetical protein